VEDEALLTIDGVATTNKVGEVAIIPCKVKQSIAFQMQQMKTWFL
jgi:hypothetical protein